MKIGSEADVKARRFTHIIDDLAIPRSTLNKIISGSEGLLIKGNDHDVMYIDLLFKVYKSERMLLLNPVGVCLW